MSRQSGKRAQWSFDDVPDPEILADCRYLTLHQWVGPGRRKTAAPRLTMMDQARDEPALRLAAEIVLDLGRTRKVRNASRGGLGRWRAHEA